MTKAIVLTVITSVLITAGQVLWKIGLHNIGGLYVKDKNILDNSLRLISSWHIMTGFVMYGLATGTFMYLLSKYRISLVIPLLSVSFIFSLFAGIAIFREKVNIYNWIGAVVIIIGVYLITRN